MYLEYEFCADNSRRAEKGYHLHCPYRQASNRAVFVALHRRLRDTGSFRKVHERGNDHLSATVNTHVLQMEKFQV